MNEKLREYIMHERAAGKGDALIRQTLHGVGWQHDAVEEVFRDLGGGNGSASRGAQQQHNRPHGSWRKVFSRALLLLVTVGVLGAAGYAAYLQWGSRGIGLPLAAHATISVVAVQTDAAGIDPTTTFIIASSKQLDVAALRGAVTVTPAVEFDLAEAEKKQSWFDGIVRTARALTNAPVFDYQYELKPRAPLEEGAIYAIAVSDATVADRSYSFAFQVKAPFQVIATHPRDQGSGVPTNSGIEISVNRYGVSNFKEQFSIEPAADGSFEVSGDTLIFVPKALAPATIYTVTIRGDLAVGSTSEILGKDVSFAFETSGGDADYDKPYFEFGNDFADTLPGTKPVVSVYLSKGTQQDLSGTLYKLPDADTFIRTYQKSRRWEWSWASLYRRSDTGSFTPDEAWKVASFTPTLIQQDYRSYVELPEALQNGLYVLGITAFGSTRYAWIQVTDSDYYFSITEEKSVLWLYNHTARAPLQSRRALFLNGDDPKIPVGETDAQGLLQFDTPHPIRAGAASASPSFLIIEDGERGERIAKINDQWGYQQHANRPDAYWDFFATDRFAYRLTDSISYWGIVRGRTEDLKQKKVTVGLYNSYARGFWEGGGWWRDEEAEPLVSQDVTVSSFDTVEGALSYEGIAPGYYALYVRYGSEIIAEKSIQILSFSKPAYQLTVTPSKRAIYAGDPVTFTIKGEFFDGTPASGVQVSYNAYWSSSVDGTVTLDRRGEATVTQAPAYIPTREQGGQYYPRSFSLNVNPTNAEEGEIFGSASVWVFGPHLHMQGISNTQQGNRHNITMKVNRIVIGEEGKEYEPWSQEYIGAPVAGQEVIGIVKKTIYERREVGTRYDYVNKTSYKLYDYTSREETVESVRGTTDAAGEWVFSRDFPEEEYVSYRVEFQTTDEIGRIARWTQWIWRYSYGYEDRGFRFGLAFSGDEGGEKQFKTGEPVSLTLSASGDEADRIKPPILLYRYQNSIERAVMIDGYSFQEPFGANFAPNVTYRAVVFGPRGFIESNDAYAVLDTEEKRLKITLTPEKKSYRPRDTINISVAVAGQDGRPAVAQVNIAAVDEALFHVLPYNWQEEIVAGLYRRIYVSPLVRSSKLEDDMPKSEGGAEFGGCFTGDTSIRMSDGRSKAIKDVRVGDVVETLATDTARALRSAVVQGVSSHRVDEFLVINETLEVTPEHEIFLNGRWDRAAHASPGDLLTDVRGDRVSVRTVRRVFAPQTTVYNIVVGDYHTYFASGVYVHNAEKGGSPRSSFVDQALFKTVTTDAAGKASVSFVAPDNITSWRLTALAYDSREIRAGQEVSKAAVTLPFFVDTAVAGAYLTGDEPQINARFFGTEYDPKIPVSATIESPSLSLNTGQSVLGNAARFSLGTLKPGVHDVTIRAEQGALKDAITRVVRVVDSYFRVAKSSTYLLAENPGSIAGNEKGFTDIRIIDAGKGRYYYPVFSRTSWYGVRLDMMVAGYLAQSLLHDEFGSTEPGETPNTTPFQTESGGLALFTYGSEDLAFSALMADAAPALVGQNNLARYFRTTLNDSKTDTGRILKALYGLASFKKPVLVELASIAERRQSTEDALYAALAYAKLGDWESARAIYHGDIRSKLQFEKGQAWLASEPDPSRRDTLTALTAVLAAHIHEDADMVLLWEYISRENPDRDVDAIHEMIVARALASRAVAEPAEVTLRTGTRTEAIKLERGESKMMQMSREDIAQLTFENISGNPMLISSYEVARDPKEISVDSRLSLSRAYSVSGKPVGVLNEGDIVKVTLEPKFSFKRGDTYQVIDYLPSGLRPITQTWERGLDGGAPCDNTWYPTKITDTGIYFTVYEWPGTGCAQLRINYYARVVTPGRYRVHPAVLQSIATPSEIALSPEERVEVR